MPSTRKPSTKTEYLRMLDNMPPSKQDMESHNKFLEEHLPKALKLYPNAKVIPMKRIDTLKKSSDN